MQRRTLGPSALQALMHALLATSGSDSPAHGLNGAKPTVAAEPAGQSTLVGETQPAANRLEQGRRSLA